MSLTDEIRQLTDKQLLKDLSYGTEGFQEGVFELYLEEARRRNLDFSEQSLKAAKESATLSESDKDGRILVVLTVLFAGLFSFIPGIFLLKKNDQKLPLYKQGYRIIGLLGIFLSLMVWFGILIFLVRMI